MPSIFDASTTKSGDEPETDQWIPEQTDHPVKQKNAVESPIFLADTNRGKYG
ncbi:hypothetical protein CLV60_12262 [Dyadobacter jiangsuensis]|uniref:Uncharacterized protein n=1 Tax=Dyadobacter jiangsuensis TaxID=1591085 RepID=A0A2P8FIB3_9BACT|nr:hypothetical protein CLV60_12262 [Dyadobacter jiangsuensis]